MHPIVFDPVTLLGLGFASHVESAVEYLKKEWLMPSNLAPYAALVISAVSQVALCHVFNVDITAAIAGTIGQTAWTCWYHEVTN